MVSTEAGGEGINSFGSLHSLQSTHTLVYTLHIPTQLRFDGTNALLLKPPDAMTTCYERNSYNAPP